MNIVLSVLAFVLWYRNLPTCLPILYPHPPQQPSAGQSNNRRAPLKSASGEKKEAHCGMTPCNPISELCIIQGSGISLQVVHFK